MCDFVLKYSQLLLRFSMIIKKATFKDYDFFFKLFCEVQNIHNALYPEIFKKSSKRTMSKQVFKEYINDKKNFILIAYRNDSPMGYLYATVKPRKSSPLYLKPKTIYINQICVTEQFRKKGIAKKMLDQVIETAKRKKINKIQLDTWDLNESAQKSFKKLGFEIFNVKMELDV